MADRVNTQSPTTEAGRDLLEWIAERLPDSGPRQLSAILAIEEAARAEGRREAVREIRKQLNIVHLRKQIDRDAEAVVVAILDRVAALNASESPPTDPCLTCNNGPDRHCPECRACPTAGGFWDCPHEPNKTAAIEAALGRRIWVGDASESVQPPEKSDAH